MPCLRLVLLLTTLLVVLMATLTSGARTTRWPKPQTTKKPPRVGGGGGPPGRYRQTTTTTPTPGNMHTDETTETMMDAYTLLSTDSTTYADAAYTAELQTDALSPPVPFLGNITLDYNECFFNFCECCPPIKGFFSLYESDLELFELT